MIRVKQPTPKPGIASRAIAARDGKPSANSLPSLIDRASKRLADAKSSAEVLEAKAAAEAALAYAKVTGAANETHADCLRIITRAEIRMAGEIDRGQEKGEVAKREANLKQNASEVPDSDLGTVTLKDLGVTKQRVSEWRKVAEAGEEKVEEAISDALADGRAPTKADINRAAGIVKDKPKQRNIVADFRELWADANQSEREEIRAIINSPSVRANMEPDDVDRSAERASSAVEVGAPVSPEGARTMRMTPLQPREANGLKGFGFTVNFDEPNPVANVGEEANGAIAAASVDPASRDDNGADRRQPASSGFTGEDDGRDVEASGGAASVITNSPSAAASAEAVVAHPVPKPPKAATAPLQRPAISAVADGQPSIPTDDARGAGRDAVAPTFSPQSTDAVASSKPFCLKLKNGHCKLNFSTSALCAECNSAKARAA